MPADLLKCDLSGALFLSQSATDLKLLKDALFRRTKSSNANEWAAEANEALGKAMGLELPSIETVRDQLLQAKPAGAMGRALSLPVRTRPTTDLLDPGTSIGYPSAKPVELHHIYPQAWCANNQHGVLGAVLDPHKADFDYVKSVANLTPLTRESNNSWRAQTPGQALAKADISYDLAEQRLAAHFISKKGYEALTGSEPDPKSFWEDRASLIATDLVSRCSVSL
jgi:hypothetical protein